MERIPKEEFQKRIGQRIKELREKQGINQAELARRCDKDRQNLERIENGKVNTTAYILYQIALGLNVSLTEIFDLDLV